MVLAAPIVAECSLPAGPIATNFFTPGRAVGMMIGISGMEEPFRYIETLHELCRRAIDLRAPRGTLVASHRGHGLEGTAIGMRLISGFMALPLTISMASIV